MNPKYLSIAFEMTDHDHEVWMALLSDWPFESFHDEDDKITGYIQDHDISAALIEFIEKHQGDFFRDYNLNVVPEKNWNEVWESSFNPVTIGHYCLIRADFHPAGNSDFRHVITIAPRMAFGTGHHATSFMMIQAMEKLDFYHKRVLDFGCGTGILSVVAALEGASNVIGVDIQPEAIENSREHAKMNGVYTVCQFFEGGLEQAGDDAFDIILSNINRSVILEHLEMLVVLLKKEGYLLISGIMIDDEEIIINSVREKKLEVISRNEKDHWIQLTVGRTG